jgi:acetate CoA/acetoacetate CoA-transferase beta subunit
MSNTKAIIASRVAQELKDGDVINLGIGLPTLVANYVPDNVHIFLQSENGIMGMGSASPPGTEDPDVVNAGGQHVTTNPGAMFFDSATSFGIIRGGHVNTTVLGALQVDEHGNLSNWIIPGKFVPGMGGAMDLVVGAKKVIVAMQHTQKNTPKILKECTLPYTARGVVDMIVTEMGVIIHSKDSLVLTEINPAYSLKDILAATEAPLTISADLKNMQFRTDDGNY